jgi:acetyl esterase/lipase
MIGLVAALLLVAAGVLVLLSPWAADGNDPSAAGGHPAGVARNLPYAGPGGPTLDVYHPGSSAPLPAVIVIHGGGWIALDKKDTAPIAQAVADAGLVAVNVNFKLAAPGKPGFPVQPRELRQAIRYIRQHASELGIDPARIGAFGDSTGAHLTSLLATTGHGSLAGGARVSAAVSWGGVYDLRRFGGPAFFRKRIATFLGCRRCPKRANAASPLDHVSRGDAAMMIVHSRLETIPLKQAKRMAKRLRAKHVPLRFKILPGKQHVALKSPKVFKQTIRYLANRLAEHP